MAGITLAQAQAQLEAWLAASLAVAQGQSYTIGSRTMTRAQAKEVSDNVDKWQRMVLQLSRGQGGIRVRYGLV